MSNVEILGVMILRSKLVNWIFPIDMTIKIHNFKIKAHQNWVQEHYLSNYYIIINKS